MLQTPSAFNEWLERVGLAPPADNAGPPIFARYAPASGSRPNVSHSPKILLLDEPFTSLDDRAIAMLSELLVEARQRGATIVISTHQLREAMAYRFARGADREWQARAIPASEPRRCSRIPVFLYRLHMDSAPPEDELPNRMKTVRHALSSRAKTWRSSSAPKNR